MAATYQVNISIGAGTSFNQLYYLTNPDMSPMDITGAQFSARLAKHPRAVDATAAYVPPVYKQIPFDTAIENGPQGEFSLSMPSTRTSILDEGKYVYSASMKDTNGYWYEVVSGLAFVDCAFGYPGPIGSIGIEGNPPTP